MSDKYKEVDDELYKEIKNIDLWKKLIIAMQNHEIEFIWVKGHASNEYNNLCDKLAVEARSRDNLLIDEGFSL